MVVQQVIQASGEVTERRLERQAGASGIRMNRFEFKVQNLAKDI
jgi:hypothetical protein